MVGLFMNSKPKKRLSVWVYIMLIFVIVFAIFLFMISRQPQKKLSENIIPTTKPTQIPIPTSIPTIAPTPKIKKINEDYYLFENEELNLSFEYRTSWGKPELNWDSWDKNNYSMYIIFPGIPVKSERDGNVLILSAVNPLAELPGRGGSWAGLGWFIKNEDYLKELCSQQNESCKMYKNKNNISIVKKYEAVGTDGGSNDFKSNQYYIYNPNSLYSGIVISDERIKKTIFPDVEKEVSDLVNSLRFIK